MPASKSWPVPPNEATATNPETSPKQVTRSGPPVRKPSRNRSFCIPLRPSRLCGYPLISMKSLPRLLSLAILSFSFTAFAAEESPEDAKIRASVPLGGDFKPNPKVGTFVVVGHGARIIVSKDDGKTWKQAFFAAPGADHGPWPRKPSPTPRASAPGRGRQWGGCDCGALDR